jgi:hypothetical protein
MASEKSCAEGIRFLKHLGKQSRRIALSLERPRSFPQNHSYYYWYWISDSSIEYHFLTDILLVEATSGIVVQPCVSSTMSAATAQLLLSFRPSLLSLSPSSSSSTLPRADSTTPTAAIDQSSIQCQGHTALTRWVLHHFEAVAVIFAISSFLIPGLISLVVALSDTPSRWSPQGLRTEFSGNDTGLRPDPNFAFDRC